MRFNAPTQVSFVVSLLLVLLAVASRLTPIQSISPNAFWILLVGYIVLMLGCIYRRR